MALAKRNNTAAAERRRSPRRRLCLDADVETSGGLRAPVVLHDLSSAGFLMESAARVAVGEPLRVRLPEASDVEARVIWSCGRHSGCEFKQRLSSAAISAALLKARPARAGEGPPRKLRLEPSNAAVTSANAAEVTSVPNIEAILWPSVALWTMLIAIVVLAIR